MIIDVKILLVNDLIDESYWWMILLISFEAYVISFIRIKILKNY